MRVTRVIYLSVLAVAFMAASGCSSSDEDNAAENLETEECRDIDSKEDLYTYLKMTRNGNDLYCELLNVLIGASFQDSYVACKTGDGVLTIGLKGRSTSDAPNLCVKNYYFMVRGIAQSPFMLKVPPIGYAHAECEINLSEYNCVTLNLISGEVVYE